jgi:hypothetical protein
MIKNVPSTFKANCKKDSVKYREYIVIDNKEIDIKGDLSDTAYKDTTFFGKFNLKMLKFETENDIDYKKKEFKYYKEVDGEAIKIGTFIVTEVKDSDTFESVNVTAYDYGLKFANPYVTSLDYSNTTLFQVIQEICTNCEVELENTSLPNGDFIVDSNQFVNGEQYGDVVAQASGINGMFATINSNDKLEFIFTNETNEIIEDYVELDDKRDTWPITSVLVATSEDLETAGAVMKDENLIAQYGEHWLKIYSYGFAYSTEKCQQLVNAIFNQVKGLAYSSFKSEYSFLPYLSLGDKIQFRNKKGELINSLILRYETNYDEITFEAPSIINASIDYTLPETTEQKVNKVGIKVDQAEKEIELLNKKVVDISTTVTGYGSVNIINANLSKPYNITLTGNIDYPVVGTKNKKNLVVGNFKVDSPVLELYINDELKQSYSLPINHLYSYNGKKDELQINYNKCTFIEKIGVDNSGSKYVLENPIIHDLGEINIEIPEGESTLKIRNLNISITYLNKNEYTNQLATQVEVKNEIKIASDEILIQSKSEILDNGDALIASINTTSTGNVKIKASDTIALEGTTTVGDKIKFNLDGSVTAQDLRLLDGGRVIGGDGLLTNLQFISTGELDSGFTFLGFKEIDYYSQYGYADCIVDAFIPDNFTITNAYITIYISSEDVFNVENVSVGNGYPKQLKLYKGSGNEITNYYVAPSSGILQHYDPLSGEEIVNAINNQATYTPTTSPGHITTVKTINLKDNLSSGRNVFILRTTLPCPESPQSTNNSTQPYLDTGIGKMVLDILGYMSAKESD